VQIATRTVPGTGTSGTIARMAGSLDAATRTMQVEIDIPNADGKLKPGMYVQASFEGQRVGTRWRVPASAVVFDAEGTRLMVVGADRSIELRPVVLGRDFGGEIEIASGVDGSDAIVTTPSAALVAGTVVEPVEPAGPKP
jgi:multidrug efflux pump subunit AcrA (membrane-fusion protein)